MKIETHATIMTMARDRSRRNFNSKPHIQLQIESDFSAMTHTLSSWLITLNQGVTCVSLACHWVLTLHAINTIPHLAQLRDPFGEGLYTVVNQSLSHGQAFGCTQVVQNQAVLVAHAISSSLNL
jgi:hypothetical protein